MPGGRYSYVINGNMIAGFALVAFPAEYGTSGIMTFLVSHHGKVYQKDLGPRTAAIVQAMQEYNPDATWTAVRGSDGISIRNARTVVPRRRPGGGPACGCRTLAGCASLAVQPCDDDGPDDGLVLVGAGALGATCR